jgi:hypothetical protein
VAPGPRDREHAEREAPNASGGIAATRREPHLRAVLTPAPGFAEVAGARLRQVDPCPSPPVMSSSKPARSLRPVAPMRTWLALGIVAVSAVGLVVISIAALYWSSDRSATTQTIFTSLLPLFGTWVGTVLAFYFARDNLEAATESTLRATGALSLSDPVATAMIRPGGIRALRVPAGGTADAIKLFDVAKLMQTRASSGSRYCATPTSSSTWCTSRRSRPTRWR